MAVTTRAVQLRNRDGDVDDDVSHMSARAAAGLVSRGRAVYADDAADAAGDDAPAPSGDVPADATVKELLAGVADGTLDADAVLAAERRRDNPRTTIIDRLGDTP